MKLSLIDELTVLAEAFGEFVMPERLGIYATDLADVAPQQLAVAFRRARRELRFFPKISELRSLAGAGVESVDYEADAAWRWVTRYIQVHGVAGETLYHFSQPRQREMGRELSDPPQTVRGEAARNHEVGIREYREKEKYRREHPEVFYEECMKLKFEIPQPRRTPAPEIPRTTAYALAQLGFGVMGGLERIEATITDPAAAGWTRKEFGEAYRRAKTAEAQEIVTRLRLDVGTSAPELGTGEKVRSSDFSG